MEAHERIRVVLADDHSVFRLGLRELLEEDGHVEVVAEADTGEEAIERARVHHPDVVVMDVRMPDKDGIEATREIKTELPSTEVIVLSAFDDEEEIFRAIDAGAAGYLVKDENPETVLRAVRDASSGKLYLSPTMAKRILDRMARDRADRPKRERRSELTTREMTVLRLMAQGKRNREIAAALSISERTVGNHIANIFSKLQVQDRTQAIVLAARRGLIKI